MKIEKKVLSDALRVLGKVACLTSPDEVLRSIRFCGCGGLARVSATNGVEVVMLDLPFEAEGVFDFGIELKTLREMVRAERNKSIDLSGKVLDWPDVAAVPDDAVSGEMPEDFTALLGLAAQVVDRFEVRRTLQGINLSADGVTATDGKQLLHLPMPLSLREDFTLPFPLALLAARPEVEGKLSVWHVKEERLFRIEIGNLIWQGKALPGNFPNWRQVIPAPNSLDYCIEFNEPQQVIDFLKLVPDRSETNPIELNVTPHGVSVIPSGFPNMKLDVEADIIGTHPRAVLALDKPILLRILQQNYRKFRASSDGMIPVVAEGGCGQFIAMPVRMIHKKENVQTQKEESQMNETKPVVSAPVPTVAPNHEIESNPMDELNAAIESFRFRLKNALDESNQLSRKVKEAVLAQKQKERDFIQARRAIERIRMAI